MWVWVCHVRRSKCPWAALVGDRQRGCAHTGPLPHVNLCNLIREKPGTSLCAQQSLYCIINTWKNDVGWMEGEVSLFLCSRKTGIFTSQHHTTISSGPAQASQNTGDFLIHTHMMSFQILIHVHDSYCSAYIWRSGWYREKCTFL